MRDTLFLRGLEARGVIGVEAWERREKQTVRIDLEMACDAAAAAREDDIEQTVNYRSVAKAVLRLVEEGAPRLVETLAERIAETVLRDHGTSWVRVRVTKPGAVRFSEAVGVEIERGERTGA
jgi:7,8-dihydroneopterin aldolase/epimerase/oxygenase